MHSMKIKKEKKLVSKKDKQLRKLINNSESDEDSEHELSYYVNDRVKLMKEVLKVIKPKRIRSMAPKCMRNLDNEEINSMLLEELLGISNKRLKAIFDGKTLNEDSSSTDEDQEPIDVISLDDVTDDDFILINSDDDTTKSTSSKTKIKKEQKRKKFKKEKPDKEKLKSFKPTEDGITNETSEKNLMSVLELLELQARARAIRSQLALESSRKAQEEANKHVETVIDDNEEDAVIIESQETEIIISSSDSENETYNDQNIERMEEKSSNEVVSNCNDKSNDSCSNLSLFSVYDAIDSAGRPQEKKNINEVGNTDKVKVIQNVVVSQDNGITENINTTQESSTASDLREEKDNINQNKSPIVNGSLSNNDKNLSSSDGHIEEIPLPEMEEMLPENNRIKKVRTSCRKVRHKKHSHSHIKDSGDEEIETKRRCHKHRKKQSIQDKNGSQDNATNLTDSTENDIAKSSSQEEIEVKSLGEESVIKKFSKKRVTENELKCSKKVKEELIDEREMKNTNGGAEDNNDSIVINVDQFEMDCVHLD